ncbi:MAG: flagellin [Melioribacteraceae bacterium]|nr:flagellin [Melioribacteraceae bacterium]
MSFSVNTNIGALKAYNALIKVNAQTEKAQLRLATLKKINSVADDTSGYSVGKKLEAGNMIMKSQLNNISSAKNLLSTAESALTQINDKLNQIAAKQVDASDPLKDSASIAKDIRTLAGEISSILGNTEINGTNLLSSTSAPSFNVSGASLTFDFSTSSLGVASLVAAVGTTNLQNATDGTVIAFDTTTVAGNVSAALGRIGNLSQALDSREEFLTAAIANSTASISSIFDADVAMEQLNATKGQISASIATAMVSQMNAAPQQILSLFR